MKLKVLLYPCPCCDTWNVDEWHYDGEKINKRHHVAEFKSVHEAAEHYRTVLGTLKGAFYDAKTDSYSDYSDDCNFIVTGSHGRCHYHLTQD